MKKLGFGFLRLPLLNKKDKHSVDYAVLNFMVDKFIENGGRYFDTAFTYLGGASEEAIRISLIERHPRNEFILADKLPSWMIRSKEDCSRIFEKQLSRCGVDFFDVYLLHWLNETNYITAETFDEFGFISELKEKGLAGKIGFSFHDSPELLDKILTAHPETDIVQLQINYLDWNSSVLRARECYEIAMKHGKEIVVMEPVKGGNLANLPKKAASLLSEAEMNDSPASYAIRFAENLSGVSFVLSGMNSSEQLFENLDVPEKLSETEISVLYKAAETIRSETAVPCTGCSYCTGNCPLQIPIPKYFEVYNEYCRNPEDDWKIEHAYSSLTRNYSRPSDCLRCRICEQNCPQKINIVETLQKVSRTFGY
ncbi:MAG: aldo/keto reductase [Oscillospiraceae bacterium]|nr:aldo/keto reductase [Oscillospiraceae bacterium]